MLQGQLGDCWLVAAMSCLAEFPRYVRSMIHVEDMQRGRFSVRLFDHIRDEVRQIPIDEFVPCKHRQWWEKEAQPLYARPCGGGIWCMLLEKAMAKMLGGYGALAEKNPGVAFRAFTGERRTVAWERRGRRAWAKMALARGAEGYIYHFFLRDARSSDEMFDEIRTSCVKGYLMGANIDSKKGTEHVRDDGLVEGHAYALLNVVAMNGLRLVCLRNPWGGEVQWRGAWSDYDT
eukprot:4835710-Amphidinium_carterae.1